MCRARMTSVMPTAATSTGARRRPRCRRTARWKKSGRTHRQQQPAAAAYAAATESSRMYAGSDRAPAIGAATGRRRPSPLMPPPPSGPRGPAPAPAPSPASPRPRSSTPTIRAGVHDRDAVAHAQHLRQLRRDHDDRQPARRPARPSAGGSRPWPRRPRPASARRGSAPPARSPASGPGRLSAGCRRRGCRPASSSDGVLIAEPLDERRRRLAAPRAKSISPPRATLPQDGQRRVGRHRHLQDDAVPAAVFRDVGDAQLDRARPGVSTATGLPRSRICPASAGVRPNSTRASSVRPAPTSPARPRISPARTVRLTPRTPDARQPRPRVSSTTSPSGTVDLREDRRRARGRPSGGSAPPGRPPPSAACRRSAPSRSTVTRSAICGSSSSRCEM